MYQFDKIKLVIWDLDDTFWRGTLTEGGMSIPDISQKLLLRLNDIGIVNSICSKNDWEPVKHALQEHGLLQYFVFPSVNWSPKGARIKQLIEDMQLRPVNVLFLDDNLSNREEVRYFCPEIMVEDPEVIPQLLSDALSCQKQDPDHARLKQYQLLEAKHQEKALYHSNEAFLMESNIQVTISHDCLAHLDRIHDLILRSNQLNFTKLRSSQEELLSLLADNSVDCGYVSVSDRFGDYGIVGFYALREHQLLHFTFSCRTLGMGIEQYIYNLLDRPKLEPVGEVISDLSSPELPLWINQAGAHSGISQMEIHDLQKHTVLIKGPCDLFQIYPYIANTELFDTEFTYTTNSGLVVESTGHTTHIVEALRLSGTEKQRILNEVPFTDAGMYCDNIFRRNYKVVFISILADCNLGVYRRKDTGERLAIMEYTHPLTDSVNWPGIISGKYPHAGFPFTEKILREFSQKYEFIGRNTPEQIIENLNYIRSRLPSQCTLAIMLGGELYYEKNSSPAYMDRHLVHQQVNQAIRKWASSHKNVHLLDVNRYLVDQSSFYDHFNHYIKPVYYALAKEMVEIVNQCTGSSVREKAKWTMLQIRLKEFLAPAYYKLRRLTRR